MNDLVAYLETQRDRFWQELAAFIAIPSISTLPEHRPDMERCARFLADHLRTIGFTSVEILPTAGHSAVWAEWTGAPGAPTVLIYGHYDVQPVDPLEEWESPPFVLTERGGALYARGIADDKGQVFMHLKALEAHLRVRGRLPVNVRLLIEGEEEIGSPSLEGVLRAYQGQLRADTVVISDTSMFARGLPSITYGLRGLVYLQIDVAGPRSDLHSGTFGGAVLNPAEALVRILAALKDAHGHILVPGFYDRVRPLTPDERAEFARLPFSEEAFRADLGVPALFGEAGYTTLERLWARPTLEINGLWGGFSGPGAKTVIPARAGAKVSCRLVPDQDPDEIADRLEQTVLRLAPEAVRVTVTRLHGARPCLTPRDHPAVQAAARALAQGFGVQPVFIREGGTIPVVPLFQERLGAPVVMVGFALPDCHAHAPNERLERENFEKGLRSLAILWDELAAALRPA